MLFESRLKVWRHDWQRSASPAEIEMLAQLNEQVATATHRRDVQAITRLNKQFHEAVYTATRNTRLAGLLNILHDSVQRFKRSTLSVPKRAEEALEEHRQILQAIRGRDADRAESLAREHKERAKRVRLTLHHDPSVSS